MKPVSAREGTVRPAAKRGQPSEEGARTQVRLQSAGLRWLLLVSGVLVLLAGVQLFVFTERTDEYFAWTVVPPVSAAFLGAGYFAAMAMEWVAVRQRTWVSARLVAVTIFFFASLTMGVTLAHLDRFHFTGPTAGTVAVTWTWMVIYGAVPPLMAVCLVVQRRMPGEDPPRVARLPAWFKALFGFHALVMVVVGIPMLVAPVATGAAVWPWELTPLTGRAVAAWLVGMGFAGVLALWEDDWTRLRPVAVSFMLLVALQLVALLRYADMLDWRRLRSWLYVLYLVDMLAIGGVALRETRRAARRRPLDAQGA
ncbi:MAG TPA: hypothetical protein VM324_00710 [Egibacteraceae bacterium]|nr:hypothetical protein [Egibacteraceae bacterium]